MSSSDAAVWLALLLSICPTSADIAQQEADETFNQVAETVHRLLNGGPNGSDTLTALAKAYGRLVTGMPPNAQPAFRSDNYYRGLQILQDTGDIIGNLSLTSYEGNVTVENFTVIIIKEVVVQEESFRDNFRGEPVYEENDLTPKFKLSAMCLVSEWTHAGFVIYPPSTSPLRPLPDIGYPILRYRTFDLIMVRLKDTADVGDDTTCSDYEYLDMLVMQRHSDAPEPNLRVGCAQWSEATGMWKSDDCFAVQELLMPTTATCYCDTNEIDKAVPFIMFEYFDDVGLGSKYDEVVEKPADPGSLTDCQKHESRIGDLADDPTLPSSFNALIGKELPLLMQFDAEAAANVSVARVLEHVGAVLAHVVPPDGTEIIGRGNPILSGFVFVTEYYRTNPVAGYAFYKNASMWTEYFRSGEATDWSRLFHDGKSYAFMFSDGVVGQNIRYGFVLYPRDKYLTPITTVAGRRVVAFRVLDTTFVKQHDLKDRREQLVTMYLNAPDDAGRTTHYGCAYWSQRNATWESAHCKMNLTIYRDVCTCNLTTSFNESRSRVQLVTYSYRETDLDVVGAEASTDYTDFEFMSTALYALQELWRYPYGTRTVGKALHLLESVLIRPNATHNINEDTKKKIVADARRLLTVNDCEPQQIHAAAVSFGALCYDAAKPTAVAMAFNKAYPRYVTASFTEAEFDEKLLITDKTVFAVRMSDSVAQQNSRYAVLVYPIDVSIHPMPRIARNIIHSRLVEVVLLTNNGSEVADQKMDLYLDQTEYNSTQGCAYWAEDWQSWTETGCFLHKVNGLTVCTCTLSIHFIATRVGGQYLVFTYSDIYFNDTAYEQLTTLRSTEVFDQAATLIHNASMVPLTDELLIKVLRVYIQLLSLSPSELTARKSAIDALLDDLALMFSRYRVDPSRKTCRSFGIASTWDVQSADVVKDLFSNAVLSAPTIGDTAVSSYMLATVFGHYTAGQDQATGVFFSRGSSESVHFTSDYNIAAAVESRPSFALMFVGEATLRYYRVVLTVYPLNMSPFPKTMTTHPVFNVRQVDVYVDLHNDLKSVYPGFTQPPPSAPVAIYFQPTAVPNGYVKTACAVWTNGSWSTSACGYMHADGVDACSCDVATSAVTRIVAFEYTDLPNFSVLDTVEPKNIIYLVGASLSLFGLVAIAAMAVAFPPWRKDLGNQLLLHLTASSFLYLSLSIYRKTHHIYSTQNYNNLALVLFTLAVHYSRLTHYCWGLAISLLQYLRFAGDVGVIAKPFLVTKMAVLAWGVPLVPLIVLLSWDTSEHFCSPSKITHLAIYLVPGAAITLLNIGFLIAIVYKINTNSEAIGDDAMTRLKTVVLMFFLFGIPTVFEMFNDLWGHSEAVEYIYKILDPIQGFVLFLFFVIVDAKSRSYWMAKVCGTKVLAGEGTQMEMSELNGSTKRSVRHK